MKNNSALHYHLHLVRWCGAARRSATASAILQAIRAMGYRCVIIERRRRAKEDDGREKLKHPSPECIIVVGNFS